MRVKKSRLHQEFILLLEKDGGGLAGKESESVCSDAKSEIA